MDANKPEVLQVILDLVILKSLHPLRGAARFWGLRGRSRR